MKQILGIRFSEYGQVQVCSYDPQEGSDGLRYDQGVMAEMDYGLNFGLVLWQRFVLEEEDFFRLSQEALEDGKAGVPLPMVRLATAAELATAEENARLGQEAKNFCRNCIAEHGLDMKLVDVETLFDRSKMIFYFTSPNRVDFRELVKDLVRQYRTRIELRQIGVRHETQMLGALGNCGMVCCCRRYLRKFAPVTIKMAKEQNLFLNPAKISGICGRLLCCLSFEQDNYDAFHKKCPKLGKRYQTSQGPMRVLRGNIFRNSIMVLPDGGHETEYSLEEWQAIQPVRSNNHGETAKERDRTNDPGDSFDDLPGLGDDFLEALFDDDPETKDFTRPARKRPAGGQD